MRNSFVLMTIHENLEATSYLSNLPGYTLIGIDIGGKGQVVTSSGEFYTTKSDERLAVQLEEHINLLNIDGIALEHHSRYKKRFKSRNKGLLHINTLIQRLCKHVITRKVVVILVDPFKSSQICSQCKMVDRMSRITTECFRCTSCGFTTNADVNAAINLKNQAERFIADNRVV